jgi:hypothetical protein
MRACFIWIDTDMVDASNWFLLNQEYSLVISSNFLGADKYLAVLGSEQKFSSVGD